MMARWRNEESSKNEIRSTLARVPKKPTISSAEEAGKYTKVEKSRQSVWSVRPMRSVGGGTNESPE
jgi:hypothetical protein